MAFVIKENDTRPKLVAYLKDNIGEASEAAINLESATEVRFYMRFSGDPTVKVDGLCVITDPAAGEVTYTWLPADTADAGEFEGEFEILWADNGIETVPNDGYFDIKIVDDIGPQE